MKMEWEKAFSHQQLVSVSLSLLVESSQSKALSPVTVI